jgi:2'-hydroxyisoflavone reductase
MKLLILGGTVFLGRHIAEIALERGHDLTLFNRGRTRPELFPEAEHLTGDRDGDLGALHGREWDAVIDTCGYFPRIVRQSVDLLRDAAGHYSFVSSLSAYEDFTQPGITEDSPVARMENAEDQTEITGESYGPLKVLCEEAVQAGFGDRAFISRPGLIVGPHDPSDRFTYWPVRASQDDPLLCPGDPAARTQLIDVRDLAVWLLDMAEAKEGGVYNAVGPAQPLTMEAMIRGCCEGAGTSPELRWAPDELLLECEVAPWMGLPLWIPEAEQAVSVERAVTKGLRFRPVAETAADTLAWWRELPDDRRQLRAGIDDTKRAEVLAKLG